MLQFLQKCSVTMRKEKKRIRFLAIIEEQLEVETLSLGLSFPLGRSL